ncbi:hypothetical protein [Streptomyces lavendofoliae]|nr:hypothetical protein [Streptomyces lavendofoliae]
MTRLITRLFLAPDGSVTAPGPGPDAGTVVPALTSARPAHDVLQVIR